jgi:hypothetical protein
MAKPAAWINDPKSFKDAAYTAARSIEGVANAAKFVRTLCPDFVTTQPPEVMEELTAGWMLRYSELHPVETYFYTDDRRNLVKGEAPKGAASIEVGIFYAMSFTPQAYGQLKNTDPCLHSVLAVHRTDFSKYRSNRKADLVSQIRKQEKAESGEVARAPTKSFDMVVVDTLDNLVTRCRNAKARGDDTANLDLLVRQIAAFKSAK